MDVDAVMLPSRDRLIVAAIIEQRSGGDSLTADALRRTGRRSHSAHAAQKKSRQRCASCTKTVAGVLVGALWANF